MTAAGSDAAGDLPPSAQPTIRVLIVDDHVLYRRGLDMVLGLEADLTVVGEAGDGLEALELVERLQPDVVVMDVRMPRCNGIDAAAAIRQAAPATRVLMLTTSDDEQDLYGSIRAGVNGYLLKDVPAEEVVAGIRAVHRGQSLISPTLASALLTEFAALSRRSDQAADSSPSRLTDRELDVLRGVARGLSNRDIARELFIAENTVKNHVRNILEKLGLRSRIEAAMYAVRHRLVDHQTP
ncbi:MAG: response regulator transcription factor [Austwickia sp.]|nr:response regulator transcription factor [Austwickia sp.]MBK8435889.1 response regulator transcription factor [Austwickia sp.]MBK9101575.1 response regulator transcription factor [Austwickia sp.]